jgi:hypothetical protein
MLKKNSESDDTGHVVDASADEVATAALSIRDLRKDYDLGSESVSVLKGINRR